MVRAAERVRAPCRQGQFNCFKGCREVEGAGSRVAGRLNLIVNCGRHVV
jgi:hypothetical protein